MITAKQNQKILFWLFFLILITTLQRPLLSQITITQSEFLDLFTPDSNFYFINGNSGMINIGNYNGPNVYDFTFIDPLNTSTGYNYEVSQIPALNGRYPSNAHTIGEGPQNIVQNPVFLESSDSTYFVGEATVENEYRFIHYVPYELFTKFPVTFSIPPYSFSQWLAVYDTTYNLNWQVQSTDQYNTIVDVWIDGYGTLKLPNKELECLRMKRAYSWFGYKEFLYLTKEGVLLVVSDVAVAEPDTGYVNGDYQLLSPDPISGVEDEQSIPMKFFLKQNYPNPFNPSTNIRFHIAERGFVSLKVFDALGNEVATLVTEEKLAGEYEVEFNPSSIKHLPSSGVYFYQLKAGSFIQTKKMLLLK